MAGVNICFVGREYKGFSEIGNESNTAYDMRKLKANASKNICIEEKLNNY